MANPSAEVQIHVGRVYQPSGTQLKRMLKIFLLDTYNSKEALVYFVLIYPSFFFFFLAGVRGSREDLVLPSKMSVKS